MGFSVIALVVVGAIAIAEPAKDAKVPGQPEMPLPPGWTMEDMQACMVAATPGKQHEHLAKGIGEWEGTCKMWMVPDSEPTKSDCKSVVTSYMDGRFVKVEMSGEMPGMGKFMGTGIQGYDNVAGTYQAIWVCNMGTNIMNGTGSLSSDEKTMTWTYTYHCPITKKVATMRDVERVIDDNTRTIESWAIDPKSGKEFKMMMIELKRK